MKIARLFVLSLSLVSVSAFAASWTGVISDAKCGAAHEDASDKSMKCVEGCVKGGQAAVFVTDGKVIKLDAKSQEAVKAHLGHKVTIDGKLKGDVLSITSVKMAS